MKEVVFITFDIDWSPDWMIEEVCAILDNKGARSTWFVTHDSPAIRNLRKRSNHIELGIHPNCLIGSTQGKSEREALAFLKQIVPEAISMRTHSLYQTTPFLLLAADDFGIRLDSSIYMPTVAVTHTYDLQVEKTSIRRVPFAWADDMAIRNPRPCWELPTSQYSQVFAFHPFHVVLNTRDYSHYQRLKDTRPLPQWTPEFIAPHRVGGEGPRMFLEKLLEKFATGRLNDLLDDTSSDSRFRAKP